jgi:hypothetical protein
LHIALISEGEGRAFLAERVNEEVGRQGVVLLRERTLHIAEAKKQGQSSLKVAPTSGV